MTPVELVHHTLVHSLFARIQLGMEQTVSVGTGLAGVIEVSGEHEEEMVSQDLGSSPGILQEALVHNDSVALALSLLTHASRGQASKFMAIGLGLAVTAELVEDQEHHSITSISNNRLESEKVSINRALNLPYLNIIARIAWCC